jgi:hypothetical protein
MINLKTPVEDSHHATNAVPEEFVLPGLGIIELPMTVSKNDPKEMINHKISVKDSQYPNNAYESVLPLPEQNLETKFAALAEDIKLVDLLIKQRKQQLQLLSKA